jgi:hypothetical protein
MTYYRQGLEAGRQARREADSQFGGPTIGPDPGGESWEQYKDRWAELLEPLFHEHMPHTEVEMAATRAPITVRIACGSRWRGSLDRAPERDVRGGIKRPA